MKVLVLVGIAAVGLSKKWHKPLHPNGCEPTSMCTLSCAKASDCYCDSICGFCTSQTCQSNKRLLMSHYTDGPEWQEPQDIEEE